MRHLIFDTETTALVSNSLKPLGKQPRIIEFYGVMIEPMEGMELRELGNLHTYINPGIDIPEEVTKITGITKEQLVDAPAFKEVAAQIWNFIGSADCVVAHNLSYDMSVLNFEFDREGTAASWPVKRICTVEHTEHIKGHRLSLTNLHIELFGDAFAKAHSAENDVRALTRCYLELRNRGEI